MKHPSIQKAQALFRTQSAAYHKKIAAAQLRCRHRHIGECELTQHSGWLERPERVCMKCGLSEIGWGCGHHALTITDNIQIVQEISRSQLQQQRLGLHITEENKYRPLSALIEEWLKDKLR